ncbi:MAG: hypothetical protein ACRD7E_00305 [Bryobacteraceae bacterium]
MVALISLRDITLDQGSGGHNHDAGRPSSTWQQTQSCYQNYNGIPVNISTTRAGQDEFTYTCANFCNYTDLYVEYKQNNQWLLVPIPNGSPNYVFIGGVPNVCAGDVTIHPDNHWATSYVSYALQQIAGRIRCFTRRSSDWVE